MNICQVIFRLFLVVGLSFLFVGCVNLPDIYLVDRHTVMENEASGEWPKMEERFLKESVSLDPVAYTKADNVKNMKSRDEGKAYKTKGNVLLNSELVTE